MLFHRRAFWLFLIVLTAMGVAANPSLLHDTGFLALRVPLIQLTGILATGSMGAAILLSLRKRWSEKTLNGLDKAYRLHRSFGIAALVFSVAHWAVIHAPGWLASIGVRLVRTGHRTPGHVMGQFEQALRTQRGLAESLGEWAFYAAVALILIALLTRIPYRIFYFTHRVIPVVFLAVVFHTVVLFKFTEWMTPAGITLIVLCLGGAAAGITSLLSRIGASRKVTAELTSFRYYPELRVIEGELQVEGNWPGHTAGQFAFVEAGSREEHHPFTIASAWDPSVRSLRFVAKELGDFTASLKERARIGGKATIEGPYGTFDFLDRCPIQIWIGAGVGITPFIARMEELASSPEPHREQYLFHTTADHSEDFVLKLRELAASSGVKLTVMIDDQDGFLTGDLIRAAIPDWRSASIWFCGPAPFGSSMLKDFQAQGFDRRNFHQELFAWR